MNRTEGDRYASIYRIVQEQNVSYATAERVDAASWKIQQKVQEKRENR